MRGSIPPLPNTYSLLGAELSTGATLPFCCSKMNKGATDLSNQHSAAIPFVFAAVMTRDSSVSFMTELPAGRPWFDFQQEQGLFLFVTAFRPTLGPTQPPVQWLTWPFHRR